jgi:hypothetical protein
MRQYLAPLVSNPGVISITVHPGKVYDRKVLNVQYPKAVKIK